METEILKHRIEELEQTVQLLIGATGISFAGQLTEEQRDRAHETVEALKEKFNASYIVTGRKSS